MAKVRFENVSKKFGELVAVNDVSFTIRDGELVVLVGPSGCGKTTTLRMIAGLEHPTDGSVYIGDTDVSGLSPRNRDVAMVFQDLALYPHKTVRGNMEFGLLMLDYPKDEITERVENAARMLEIEDKLDRRPSELSGGQQQRVALGRALVRDPEVFLLDEPLASLDAKLRESMRAEILELHNNIDSTMVYVTHDQEIAMTLGDRIAVMNEGQIQQIDQPSNVYQSPDNLFVGQFIGSPDMNVFDARTTIEGDSVRIGSDVFDFLLRNGNRSVEELKNRDVVVGIRPQDIHYAEQAPSDLKSNPEFTIDIEIVEEMGSVTDVHFTRAKKDFIARFNTTLELEIGQSVPIIIDIANLHLFDSDTGERIDVLDREVEGTH